MNCSGKMKHESDTYSRPTRRKSDRTSVLSRSMGNPPILTIMALAKKIAKTIDF